jgi:endonuclease/exonuclease/phosphatase family metal-dependent hydrolase
VSHWNDRANKAIKLLREEILPHTSILALQEFWLESNYSKIFSDEFARSGYQVRALQRSSRKMDSVAILVNRRMFHIIGSECLTLCYVSDRVALLLWLKHIETGKDILFLNTHLSFPHNNFDRQQQLSQIHMIVNSIERYAKVNNIPNATRIVTGDFNTEYQSPVCEQLTLAGYLSCVNIARPRNLCDVDTSFVTHKTHLAEELGVDHIFIKPEMSQVKPNHSTAYVEETTIVPVSLPCNTWNELFEVSDHRPLEAQIVFTSE